MKFEENGNDEKWGRDGGHFKEKPMGEFASCGSNSNNQQKAWLQTPCDIAVQCDGRSRLVASYHAVGASIRAVHAQCVVWACTACAQAPCRTMRTLLPAVCHV